MKIVFLNGGLANQVFQYIFYRYAQIKRPDEEWYLDDSFFFVHNVHNGYELEKVFGLKPNLLSRYFDEDVWEYMITLKREQGKGIPQILMENGMDIEMVAESNNWNVWNPFAGNVTVMPDAVFNPDIVRVGGNVYYHGYWLTSEWFHEIADQLKKELLFSEITETVNRMHLQEIDYKESCSIHIRRGDYLALNRAPNDGFYKNEIEEALKDWPEITLFVFSDEIGYCREHAADMGLDLPKETVFIDDNRGKLAYRDLQLMSRCKYMINGNSAFCYLAALLNQNLKGIINPTGRKL